MNNTYYLRALDRATLVAALVGMGLLVDDDDGTRPAAITDVWDEIGAIYDETGETDADGMPVMAPVVDENGTPYWHANIYSAQSITLPSELLAEPASPRRMLWQ